MGDAVDIVFYIKPRPINKELVTDIVNTVLDIGSKYDDYFGYASAKTWISPEKSTLDEVIEVVSKDEGTISFSNKILYYNLRILPQETEEHILGRIEISIDHGALKETERYGKERVEEGAQAFIEIAKAVWNTLEPKPIYGVGDDFDYLPMLIGDSPSEKEILNLEIEPHIYWLNFYGPDLLKKFGKSKLLSLQAHKVEELNEGILIMGYEVPKAYSKDYDAVVEASSKIKEHLGWRDYHIELFSSGRMILNGKFLSLESLRDFLETDIEQFRERIQNAKIFATIDVCKKKPCSQTAENLRKWLKGEMNVEVVTQ